MYNSDRGRIEERIHQLMEFQFFTVTNQIIRYCSPNNEYNYDIYCPGVIGLIFTTYLIFNLCFK